MLKKEFIEKMKNDSELQELKEKVIAITGKKQDVCFVIGASYTYEEWKENLKKIIEEHDTASH